MAADMRDLFEKSQKANSEKIQFTAEVYSLFISK